MFQILESVLEQFGLGPKEKPIKSNYDLGKDPEALKQEMQDMGYTNIKMWY